MATTAGFIPSTCKCHFIVPKGCDCGQDFHTNTEPTSQCPGHCARHHYKVQRFSIIPIFQMGKQSFQNSRPFFKTRSWSRIDLGSQTQAFWLQSQPLQALGWEEVCIKTPVPSPVPAASPPPLPWLMWLCLHSRAALSLFFFSPWRASAVFALEPVKHGENPQALNSTRWLCSPCPPSPQDLPRVTVFAGPFLHCQC